MADTHFPWDEGAVTGSWLLVGQKTVKAQCGKRVAFSTMTLDSRITCAMCRAKLTGDVADLTTFAATEANNESPHIRDFAKLLGNKATRLQSVLDR